MKTQISKEVLEQVDSVLYDASFLLLASSDDYSALKRQEDALNALQLSKNMYEMQTKTYNEDFSIEDLRLIVTLLENGSEVINKIIADSKSDPWSLVNMSLEIHSSELRIAAERLVQELDKDRPKTP